jgi:hypothetical protein
MDFSIALLSMKAGLPVARATWWKGEYAFIRPETVVPQSVVPKMNSMPSAVQERMVALQSDVRFDASLCLATAPDRFAAWLPSNADLFATDWAIVEPV